MTLHWGPYLSLNTWPSHLEDHYSLLDRPGYKVIGGYSSNDMIVVLFRLGQWYYPEQWLLLPFAYLFFGTTVEASAVVAMAIMRIIFSVCEMMWKFWGHNPFSPYSASCKSGWWIWSPNFCWTMGNPWDYTSWKGYIFTWKCWIFNLWCTPPNGGMWKSITVELCYAFILHHTAK